MKFSAFILCTLSVLVAVSCGTSNKAPRDLKPGESNVNASKTMELSEKDQKAYSNIYEYLRSRVPGLLIRGTDISIRGINSVNSATAPLILVDGIEMTDISALNPYDVQRVEVLKDSATAIYGFRGSGGVILITTKSK